MFIHLFLSPLGLVHRFDSIMNNDLQANPLVPKITMVGISMSEGGHMSKANLMKIKVILHLMIGTPDQLRHYNSLLDFRFTPLFKIDCCHLYIPFWTALALGQHDSTNEFSLSILVLTTRNLF